MRGSGLATVWLSTEQQTAAFRGVLLPLPQKHSFPVVITSFVRLRSPQASFCPTASKRGQAGFHITEASLLLKLRTLWVYRFIAYC